MSGRYILSPLAKADIDRIWTDTANTWGLDQAETYIRQLGRHLQIVADHPSVGRFCPEVRTGYRKYPSGSHVFFYRNVGDIIDVVRVLHQRMDFKQHL